MNDLQQIRFIETMLPADIASEVVIVREDTVRMCRNIDERFGQSLTEGVLFPLALWCARELRRLR